MNPGYFKLVNAGCVFQIQFLQSRQEVTRGNPGLLFSGFFWNSHSQSSDAAVMWVTALMPSPF